MASKRSSDLLERSALVSGGLLRFSGSGGGTGGEGTLALGWMVAGADVGSRRALASLRLAPSARALGSWRHARNPTAQTSGQRPTEPQVIEPGIFNSDASRPRLRAQLHRPQKGIERNRLLKKLRQTFRRGHVANAFAA